mgnify:CR=1 FL=1
MSWRVGIVRATSLDPVQQALSQVLDQEVPQAQPVSSRSLGILAFPCFSFLLLTIGPLLHSAGCASGSALLLLVSLPTPYSPVALARIPADARLLLPTLAGKNEYSLKFFNLSFEGEGEADE